MEELLQNKIATLTLKYIELYPEEYKAVCIQLQGEREKSANDFSSLNADKMVKRKIFEIPETLNAILNTKLTVEELSKFKQGKVSIEYSRWFAKRFKEFSSSRKI